MMLFCKNLKYLSSSTFRRGCGAAFLLAGLLLTSGSASGFQANPSSPDAAQDKTSGQQFDAAAPRDLHQKLSASRIAELRAFAKAHHPEMTPLLDFLEEKRPTRFRKVIQGLHRDVSSLERLKKRSTKIYERALAAWINSSQIQLYAAQYKVATDDETAAELREKIHRLLEESLDARVIRMEQEIAALELKASRMKRTLGNIKTNREKVIEKKIKAATEQAVELKDGVNSPEGEDSSNADGN